MRLKRGYAISQEIIEGTGQTVPHAIEEKVNFWINKSPCWEMCHCPARIRDECPAIKYQFLPCWQIEGTYCKLDDYGLSGADSSICQVCRVYKKYGGNTAIEIKLFGRGINSSLKSLEKAAGIDFGNK